MSHVEVLRSPDEGFEAEGKGAVDVYGVAYHAGHWDAVGCVHVRWASHDTARAVEPAPVLAGAQG